MPLRGLLGWSRDCSSLFEAIFWVMLDIRVNHTYSLRWWDDEEAAEFLWGGDGCIVGTGGKK